MKRVLLTLSAAAVAACGSPTGTPTPSPTAATGGPVTGRYLVQITPGPACGMSRGPFSFPMQAAPGGASPHPGVQVLLEGDGSRFELEFLSTEIALRGGLGTTAEGVLANEGLRVWVNAVGTGSVFRSADGRGQITSGTLAGDISLSTADGDQGDLGSCRATDHAFTLRPQ
jgi:hypothetical protein